MYEKYLFNKLYYFQYYINFLNVCYELWLSQLLFTSLMFSSCYVNIIFVFTIYIYFCLFTLCMFKYLIVFLKSCAPGYVRRQQGSWLGQCYKEDTEVCPIGMYGSPPRGIPCRHCPCPLTSSGNQ